MNHDRRLAERVAHRERRASTEFLDSYGARVHRLALRYARSASDAEDLTQEIFIDLFRSIGSFRGAASLSTWVYRVALNHCLKDASRTRPVTVTYEEALGLAMGQGSDPAHCAEHAELADRIAAALDTLSAEHRTVVILHEMHGLTYSECADVLDVPVGTVKSRLFTAFRRLRECLGDYVSEAGSSL